jgi:hypothetical protein
MKTGKLNIIIEEKPFLHKEDYENYQVSLDNLSGNYRLWLIEGNHTYIFSFNKTQIPKLLSELERKTSLGEQLKKEGRTEELYANFDEVRLKSLYQMVCRYFPDLANERN